MMDQKKLFIPETFSDENNKLIHNPKVVISSFNVKIGDIIKEDDLLCNLDLITKDMSYICPIHASDEDTGYISDILFETNETVKSGSAIFIIDAQKQKVAKKWKAKVNSSKTFDWESNDKLYDQTASFLEKLDNDFREISKKKEDELKAKIFKEVSDFKIALGLHYNFFEKIFLNNEIENKNINDTFPHSLPLGHFSLSFKGLKHKLINLIDFPIGNVALTTDDKDQLQFLHDIIVQSISSSFVNIKPNLIKIRGLSFKDFGYSLMSLTSFDKRFFNEVIIDENSFEEFCKEIEDRIIEIRKKCLISHDTLIEFNKENPDRAEPFYFVFCSLDDDFPKDLEERLLKFLNSESIGKAGIFFYVISLNNKLLGNTYDLKISINSIHKSKRTTLNLFSNKLDLSHLDKLDLNYSLLSKKTFSALVNIINNKEDLVILDPFIDDDKFWFNENSSKGIKVPLGYAADSNIEFIIGHNTTNYNALIGGGVGSGKSVLLHNLILGIATRYDVNECLFLLLDYKEGTEFLPYQSLPHTHVLSTESDPVFGLRTLEYINDEITKRGVLFKKAGVSNINKYRAETKKSLPRWIIIIDEFQRMFQEQSVMSKVEKLFDDLNRRGRAFGIHFVLATQSIYDLNMTPATLSQLSIRICLKISEMDASKILHVDNLIPATFDKPGMAIYNNNIGLIDSNLQMQVPFIDSTKIKNTILQISKKNTVKTYNYISKGQQFEIFDSALVESKNSVAIGCLQDIKKTYFNLNIDPKAYSPLLIIGNEKQKLKLLFNSFVRDYITNNKNINVFCLDFHPLNMDNVSNSLLKKDNIYKYSNNEENFFEDLIKIKSKLSNSKKINLLLILGLDESLSFKENITDDIGSPTDNKTKENLLNIIRERLSLNLIPIVFIRKLSNFQSVFNSQIYENSISSEVFSRRIFMDTPQEFNYDYGSLSKYKVFYHDHEKITQQILTIFE